SPELMDEKMLNETLEVVYETLLMFEHDVVATRNFKGLVALSHPKHNLYYPMTDPSKHDREEVNEMGLRWNYLMDCIPRYFDGQTRIIQIAERHQLPFNNIYEYLQKFSDKDLVTLSPAPFKEPKKRNIPPY
ncbi:MAG: hypothetical protein EBE86_035095, partial [Hormoscilla sp. GUM202]|nr:hypothetical protein [Hormoscilla sp. GUM202]